MPCNDKNLNCFSVLIIRLVCFYSTLDNKKGHHNDALWVELKNYLVTIVLKGIIYQPIKMVSMCLGGGVTTRGGVLLLDST